jgi:hypothetical protein
MNNTVHDETKPGLASLQTGRNGAAHILVRSLDVPESATTLAYAVTTAASKQSGALTAAHVVIYADQDMWCMQGVNPTAAAPVADGAAGSMRIKGGEQYRVRVAASGNKFAFRAVTANGSVEITPAA